MERVSGEPIKIRNVYMIANGKALFCSQPIRRAGTVPKVRQYNKKFALTTLFARLHEWVHLST